MSRADADIRAGWTRPDIAQDYDRRRFAGAVGRISNALDRRNVLRALDLGGIRPGARVLDLPAGTGRMSDALSAAGYRVLLGDFSDAMLAQARLRPRNRNAPSLRADAKQLPLKTGSVDATVSLRFLGHFPRADRVAMLQELARVSRGVVLLEYCIPTRSTELGRGALYRLTARRLAARPWSWNTVDEAGLRSELQEAGLHELGRVSKLPGASDSRIVVAARTS